MIYPRTFANHPCAFGVLATSEMMVGSVFFFVDYPRLVTPPTYLHTNTPGYSFAIEWFLCFTGFW
jgi:hypothetical protein